MTLREEIVGCRMAMTRSSEDAAYNNAIDDVLAIVDRHEPPSEEQLRAHSRRCHDPEHCVDDPPAPHESWRGCFENAKREPLPSEERPAREAVERFGVARGDDERSRERCTLAIVEAIDALAAAIREDKR